jgi:hypothetical protein
MLSSNESPGDIKGTFSEISMKIMDRSVDPGIDYK